MAQQSDIRDLFEKQMAHYLQVGKQGAKLRIAKLERLKEAISGEYREKFQQALWNDFRKPKEETDLTELFPILQEIRHTKKHLSAWMSKQRVSTPLTLLGSQSYYYYEPRGVCLILSPWNFPVNLTLGPLVSAIAAGNTVILKPSEMTPHTSAVMRELIASLFPEEEVAMVLGDVETAKALLELPFHHIFFTGSPAIGKKVMAAASQHLTSVTLELGGKSPVIVDDTADLKVAAERIAWGKFTNAGQICVSPDYLLVHEKVKDALVSKIREQVRKLYGAQQAQPGQYAHIVNSHHYHRLEKLLEDAVDKGARVIWGGDRDPDRHYLEPTLLEEVRGDSSIMQEEIFGPLLPVQTFGDLEDAVAAINAKERPLALYIFGRDRKRMKYILANTRAGSTGINTTVLQYGNNNLPFGGINNSGMGKSHGIFGFREFSNTRSVLKQGKLATNNLLYPPYSGWKQRAIDAVLKWL